MELDHQAPPDPQPASAVPRDGSTRTSIAMLLQLLRGYSMGAADLVPGVSGGTIALVFGIYDELIAEIHGAAQAVGRLLRGDGRGVAAALRAVHWRFLVPLLLGIVVAIVTLAGPLRDALSDHPVLLSAAFFGLIVGSIVVAFDEVRRLAPGRLVVFAAVAVATFLVLGLRGRSIEDPGLLVMFGAGAVAVCAMILPGISGSFILLMMGLYQHVLDVVHERGFVELAVFSLGAATGLASFSTGLNWLIERHRDTVMAALIGLLAGSLRVLWPWPSGPSGVGDVRLGAPVAADLPAAAGLGLAGAVLVVLLARIGLRMTEDEPLP